MSSKLPEVESRMSNLTQNAINQIIRVGDPPEGFSPTLQILSVRPIQATATQGERYRVVISDGVYFAHGMLAKQLNHFITEFSVVRVTQFMTTSVSNKNVVILLNLELLNNPGFKIGNPVAATDAPGVNAGMKQQQPPNVIPMYNSGKETDNSVTTNSKEEGETTTKRKSRSTRIDALSRGHPERSPSPPPVPILVPITNSKSSSTIQEAGYDELTNDLYVKWFHNDVVYRYPNVSTSVLRDCETTQSFGRYMTEFKRTAHGRTFKRHTAFKWNFKQVEVCNEISNGNSKKLKANPSQLEQLQAHTAIDQTVVMGASFRNVDEILQLAGCDKLTIAPALLEELSASSDQVERKLDANKANDMDIQKIDMDEKTFRWMLNQDAMATEKLAEGIRGFSVEIEKLEDIIKVKIAK